ncbi:SRA stem-loop-interacting RNA-binding protein, mitochondrial [Athalia rosae]|uniref:SRA stem-loop-interacting RNA-binding protein, mitochondrial n=1 Tax=Athalia rosae TaxID=37344 RepID=UPI0006254713|nr:SRA stem-loop-interacting RNA-binding protein, mitochondrial [Athalia rosae]
MATRAALELPKLTVRNLPWTVGTKQLADYFSNFGVVSKSFVTFDKNTGMSQGFGFVVFADQKGMKAAQQKKVHFLEGNTLYLTEKEISSRNFE